MGKGGARRQKVPETDLEHLLDVVKDFVKQESNFEFKGYQIVGRTQAVQGHDLASLAPLLLKLISVQPQLLFSYMDLKAVFNKVVQAYPFLRDSYPAQQLGNLPSKLAQQTMTLCAHARRIKDSAKFRECTRSLPDWQILKLEEVRKGLELCQSDLKNLEASESSQNKSTGKEGKKLQSTQKKSEAVKKLPSQQLSTPKKNLGKKQSKLDLEDF